MEDSDKPNETSDKPNSEVLVLKQLKSIKIALWVLATFIMITALMTLAGWVVGGFMTSGLHDQVEVLTRMAENTTLPKPLIVLTNSPGPTPSKLKDIKIHINKDGSYKMGDKVMNLDQITIKLKEEGQSNNPKSITLYITADKELPFSAIVNVRDVARSTGILDIIGVSTHR